MENKQTAVDFLEESIHLHCLINDYEDVMIDYNTLDKLFMKARAMEKEQIMKAYMVCEDSGTLEESEVYADKYYNETYGK